MEQYKCTLCGKAYNKDKGVHVEQLHIPSKHICIIHDREDNISTCNECISNLTKIFGEVIAK